MKTIQELNAAAPNLVKRLSKAAANTLRIKSNGAEYATVISAGLPILENWAATGNLPEKVLTAAGQFNVKGNSFQVIALVLCGRGEHGHNMGISANSQVVGKQAAAAACKRVGRERAAEMLAVMLVAKTAQDSAAKAAATRAAKRAPKTVKKAAIKKA